MIAVELLLLIAMAVVVAATLVGSARSHTRSVAWATPAPTRVVVREGRVALGGATPAEHPVAA